MHTKQNSIYFDIMKYIAKHGLFWQPKVRVIIIRVCTSVYDPIHVQV